MSDDIVTWLTGVLDHREQLAIAASARGEQTTPTGEHWQWVCRECDTPIDITPVTMLDSYLECPNGCGGAPALRSVEHYPTSVGTLPHFLAETEEITPAVAAFVLLGEPAAELADVAAKRALIAAYMDAVAFYNAPANRAHPAGEVHGLFTAIKIVAGAYKTWPGWREEWS